MSAMSTKAALEDAGLSRDDIEGIGIYHTPTPNQSTSSVSAALMLGMKNIKWFMTGVEGPAFLSSAIPAIDAVASGRCETTLSVRTLSHPGSSSGSAIPQTGYGDSGQFLYPFGAFSTGQWCALLWRRHMEMYGSTEEQLGYQPIYQREFAALNEEALLRDPMTMEDYLASRYISKPLRLFDCEYPISGSGAVIFTTEERARDLRQPAVIVEASSLVLDSRPDFYAATDILRTSPFLAAQELWRQTDLTVEDIDVGGLYDGFTVITLNWLEALGFCKEGESGAFVEAGHTRMGGSIPINCDGGTLNMGRLHAANHVIEVTRQLRGQSGVRQVPDAEVGVVTAAIGPYAGTLLLTRG
jgi:acetyl-CoA acetyltransferase